MSLAAWVRFGSYNGSAAGPDVLWDPAQNAPASLKTLNKSGWNNQLLTCNHSSSTPHHLLQLSSSRNLSPRPRCHLLGSHSLRRTSYPFSPY